MFKKLFSRNKSAPRQLEQVDQLQVGDMVLFKYRESLPPELREKQLEVTELGTYEYSSGRSKELVLKDEENNTFYLSLENDDGEVSLCLAKKISRGQVSELFDEQQFGELWGEQWADLAVQIDQQQLPEALSGWLTGSYRQSVKDQQVFYYERDVLSADLSDPDDGEELRIHECEGDDDSFGLNIEISDDGSTAVFLQVYCPTDVIAQLDPGGAG
ncbi:MAG: hypothetical protein JKY89_11290 [Immundisolibacteraceae bacterium]|nr:hypothetical protein [Immundisolibacteraceae bacterium]